MTQEPTWVGVDVCQAVLDIHLLPMGETLQQPNNELGVPALIERLQLLPSCLVVVEATGGLERLALHNGNMKSG